jgi:hypothetical protein
MKDKINNIIKELCEQSLEIAPEVIGPKKIDIESVKPNFVQYIKNGNGYTPAGEIQLVETLPPFAYNVAANMSGLPTFTKVKPMTDELYLFENSKMSNVLDEVKKFWTLKDNFNKLGYLHNRGILLYGPPGTGKSCLIQQVSEAMIGQGDTLFVVRGVHDAQAGLKAFREVEPDRRAVVVLEDLDEYIGYQERDLLQLLDGSNSVDNVLYLGTTNYIEKFPPRLLRPGRFDKKIHVDYPPYEGRLIYLQRKIGHLEEEQKIQDVAKRTEGFSYGHLRELIIGWKAFGENVDSVLLRLYDLGYKELPKRDSSVIESIIRG